LLEGLNPHYAGSLPTNPAPMMQVVTDLQALDRVGELADGSRPMRVYLENACGLPAES